MRTRSCRRKRIKRKTRKQTGCGMIAANEHSAVYYPAIPCKDGKTVLPGTVSKLTTRRKAELEMKAVARIQETVRDFAIVPITLCPSSVVEDNKDTLLISPYAGESLKTISKDVWRKNLHTMVSKYIELVEAVRKWNKTTGFVHMDITLGNTTWDGSEFKLIDFERVVNINDGSTAEDENDEFIHLIRENLKNLDVMNLYLNLADCLNGVLDPSHSLFKAISEEEYHTAVHSILDRSAKGI